MEHRSYHISHYCFPGFHHHLYCNGNGRERLHCFGFKNRYGKFFTNRIHRSCNGKHLQWRKRYAYRKRWRNLFMEHRLHQREHQCFPIIYRHLHRNGYKRGRLHCNSFKNSECISATEHYASRREHLQRSERNAYRNGRRFLFMEYGRNDRKHHCEPIQYNRL